MNRFFGVLAVALTLIFSAYAQEARPYSTGADETSSRFELIKTVGGATFRLDKYAGRIHRLATCPRDDSEGSSKCWKEMTIVDPPKPSNSAKPRFQIYIDGSLVFLLQTDTGQAWQFGLDPLDKWHPFLECNDKTSMACQWRP